MEIEKYFPEKFCRYLYGNIDEISDISLILGKNMFANKNGEIVDFDCFVTRDELDSIVNKMCRGSIYSNQLTLKKGYLTLQGGHRVGVVGEIVLSDSGEAEYMRNISGINIRIARCVHGACDKIIPYIIKDKTVYNTLIIAPPSSGKTTILKDIISQLGDKLRIGVADERGELSEEEGGKYVFIVKGCTKHDGILMLLRSMSPHVIITDEIGADEDEKAIERLLNAGVKIICTAHGYNEKDIMRREVLKNLILSKAFERIVIVSDRKGPGTLEKVINT